MWCERGSCNSPYSICASDDASAVRVAFGDGRMCRRAQGAGVGGGDDAAHQRKGGNEQQGDDGDGEPERQAPVGAQAAEEVKLKGELAGFVRRDLAVFAAFHEQPLVVFEKESAPGGQRTDGVEKLFRFPPVHLAVGKNRFFECLKPTDHLTVCHDGYYTILR